jgi:hypothetical protein
MKIMGIRASAIAQFLLQIKTAYTWELYVEHEAAGIF